MMAEPNVNKENDNAADAATLKEKLEKVENEKLALEMKLRESDDDLYSEDYLAFIQDRKEKNRSQDSGTFGGRIGDYTDEQMQEMATSNLPQLIKVIAGEVYTQIRSENDKEMTRKERDAQKERIAKARVEITKFASERPDFKSVAPLIKDIGKANPNLTLKQLYKLAGGKHPDGIKKEDPKKDDKGEVKLPPNTVPKGEVGIKESDKNLSIREVMSQEFKKIKTK